MPGDADKPTIFATGDFGALLEPHLGRVRWTMRPVDPDEALSTLASESETVLTLDGGDTAELRREGR